MRPGLVRGVCQHHLQLNLIVQDVDRRNLLPTERSHNQPQLCSHRHRRVQARKSLLTHMVSRHVRLVQPLLLQEKPKRKPIVSKQVLGMCEGVGDVVGVVTPLGGVAQVGFHGVKSCRGRCSAQGASGQRSGRRLGRTG